MYGSEYFFMRIKLRKPFAFMGLILVGLLICSSGFAIDSVKFEGGFETYSFVESVKKDYFEAVYSPTAYSPDYVAKQYDKSFLSSANDINLKLKIDVNENVFTDFSERIYVRSYNTQDPLGLDYSSYRHDELDHEFNLRMGVNSGEHDYFQLDFFNSALALGDFEVLNYKANKGSAMFSHEFNKNGNLSILGSYEERKYDTDIARNYKESRVLLSFASVVPQKNKYKQVAASTRGSKEYFKTLPDSLKPVRAIEYYTDYEVNPHDSDPGAKYMRRQKSGEVVVKGFGEVAKGDLTELANDYRELIGGFEALYEAAEDMTVRISDTYRRTEYGRESMLNYLYDNSSNYIALTLDHDFSDRAAQSLTFSNERVAHKSAGEEDFRVNAVTYEGFYRFGQSVSSVMLGGARRRFDEVALNYVNENELRYRLGYDFYITESIRLRAKHEYVDSDYLSLETELYSSYKRRMTRAALEKTFTPYTALELAYQQSAEKHSTFTQNNTEEKVVGMSFRANF